MTRDNAGATALHYAAHHGYSKVVQYLLLHGEGAINAQDKEVGCRTMFDRLAIEVSDVFDTGSHVLLLGCLWKAGLHADAHGGH